MNIGLSIFMVKHRNTSIYFIKYFQKIQETELSFPYLVNEINKLNIQNNRDIIINKLQIIISENHGFA